MSPGPGPGPQLVHAQFNSPIGLYSQQNIRETLDKHLHNLPNGSVGIDFNAPGAGKPNNLANSAVLRLLEEEENQRHNTGSGQKKVVWPPTYDNYSQPQTQPPVQNQQQTVPQYHNQPEYNQQPAYKQPVHQQPASKQPAYQQPAYKQPAYQPAYNQKQNRPSYAPQVQPARPAVCEGLRQEQCGLSKLIPTGPGLTTSPVAPRSPAAPPRSSHNTRWAPVPAPVSPQSYGSPQPPAYREQPPAYAPAYSEQTYESYQTYNGPPQNQRPEWARSPPPATVTLRQQAPVHQPPPPVYASQAATNSYRGGSNMRGDQKWPPASVREAVEAENEARRQLARGPACRPRKVKKDYSSFFAAHALNSNYPSYRTPPGTQHYEDHNGRTSY